jgi:hypothetical protein
VTNAVLENRWVIRSNCGTFSGKTDENLGV